jgi:hypothetical protein
MEETSVSRGTHHLTAKWQVTTAAEHDPLAQLFDDLHVASEQFRKGRHRDSWIGALTAVVRLLETHRASVAPDTAASLSDMAFPLLMLAELLVAMPDSQAEWLQQHPVIIRNQHALVAACVEALCGRGWSRREAAVYVASTIKVGPSVVLSWRDVFQHAASRHTQPTSFAELNTVFAAALSRGQQRHQRKDVALYAEQLRALAALDKDALLERISLILNGLTFGNFRQHLRGKTCGNARSPRKGRRR